MATFRKDIGYDMLVAPVRELLYRLAMHNECIFDLQCYTRCRDLGRSKLKRFRIK